MCRVTCKAGIEFFFAEVALRVALSAAYQYRERVVSTGSSCNFWWQNLGRACYRASDYRRFS
jgi:hypothetical protein